MAKKMMLKYTTLFFMAISIASCSVGKLGYRTLENTQLKKLKGQIKSTTTYYSIPPNSNTTSLKAKHHQKIVENYNKIGDVISRQYFNYKEKLINEVVRTFDTKNNEATLRIYENGKMIAGYDVEINDNEKRIVKRYQKDINYNRKLVEIYDYDKKGNKIRETKFRDSNVMATSVVEYSYDHNEKLIKSIISSPDNEVLSRTLFKYNNLGLRVETKTFNASNELTTLKTNEYDTLNNLKVATTFLKDGSIIDKITYTYNNNNEVVSKETQSSSKDETKVSYNYEYDNNRNWVVKETLKEGTSSIEKREIEYYE